VMWGLCKQYNQVCLFFILQMVWFARFSGFVMHIQMFLDLTPENSEGYLIG